ncbi:MAG: nucleoside triphosphate pyrophosphohydrolase, partial [Schwartzia succinivorans]|nr:nucleoside triphosphate pyrophosphohydrolase [Schwartzia succinivorans]
MGSITVVGMGPGSFGLMSMEAWELMQNAPQLVLRTAVHPTADELKKKGIRFSSFDERYESADDFESLYNSIAEELTDRAAEGEELVYAVPGSPLVAERTVVLLREKAEKKHVELKIHPAMSFVEVLYTRLGIDPISGLTIVDAADLERLPLDIPTGIVITQVYSPMIASEAKLSLMELLPDEFEIIYTHNLGLPDESIRKIPLYELDRQPDIDHLTSVYIPARKKDERFDFAPFTEIMRRLREPGGCPWDREQTPESLRKHILEEAYEVIEAIDKGDKELLCEELGDLLLQIVFQARIAEETGHFSMQDVIDGIADKMIRRHPHIFGDIEASDAAAVMVNWEAIKRREKPERSSAIDGLPPELPGLMAAAKLQQRAASVGFEWPDIDDAWSKCREEAEELKEAV